MPRLRQNVTAQMGTRDIWMWSTRADIFTTFTIRMTPSRWKVSTLICAIISQHWPDGADVFQGNWRTFRQFLLFSFRPITVLDSRRTAIVPAILAQLSPFLSLTSFNSLFGHSPAKLRAEARWVLSTPGRPRNTVFSLLSKKRMVVNSSI